jgi:hypothetical protein
MDKIQRVNLDENGLEKKLKILVINTDDLKNLKQFMSIKGANSLGNGTMKSVEVTYNLNNQNFSNMKYGKIYYSECFPDISPKKWVKSSFDHSEEGGAQENGTSIR